MCRSLQQQPARVACHAPADARLGRRRERRLQRVLKQLDLHT